jgi:ABC-type phosphate transport system substrate-binding protein
MLKICSLCLTLLCLAWPAASAPAVDRPFAVIAAPGATDHRLTRETVSLIFKRKQNFWETGSRIQPVNLPPTHPLRQTFSQIVLGQGPEAMEDYWREMYFHGVLPPHVLASEEAVILFVSATPGAIGYISACPAERKLNVVLLVGDVPGCSRQ